MRNRDQKTKKKQKRCDRVRKEKEKNFIEAVVAALSFFLF